jgi:hypothetical protein
MRFFVSLDFIGNFYELVSVIVLEFVESALHILKDGGLLQTLKLLGMLFGQFEKRSLRRSIILFLPMIIDDFLENNWIGQALHP